jgi:phage terminase small subunit
MTAAAAAAADTAAAERPLAPRIELFCRTVARGGSLAEAARRAGYAAGSARQRGSELWAREEVQARIGMLSAEEEERGEALVERMRRQQEELYDRLVEHGHFAVAARLLMHRWRFEKEVGTLRAQTWAERDRLHEELREEVRDELRAELIGEVRAELVAELRRDLVEGLRRELHADLLAEMRAKKAKAAAPGAGVTERDVLPVTNRDVLPEIPAPVPAGPLAVAAAAPKGGSLKARLRDLPLPVAPGALAQAR